MKGEEGEGGRRGLANFPHGAISLSRRSGGGREEKKSWTQRRSSQKRDSGLYKGTIKHFFPAKIAVTGVLVRQYD